MEHQPALPLSLPTGVVAARTRRAALPGDGDPPHETDDLLPDWARALVCIGAGLALSRMMFTCLEWLMT